MITLKIFSFSLAINRFDFAGQSSIFSRLRGFSNPDRCEIHAATPVLENMRSYCYFGLVRRNNPFQVLAPLNFCHNLTDQGNFFE